MESVCGLDVHKDSVYLCILSEFGELIEKVFGVLTFQLEEMRDLMLHYHVVEVSMESTSVYWIPIWRVLSPPFKQNLANPYFIKQLPVARVYETFFFKIMSLLSPDKTSI